METLRKNIRRNLAKVEEGDTNHGNCALTSAQEMRFVGYLRAFDINGCAFSKHQTISLARNLFFSNNDNWDGRGWFSRFKTKYDTTLLLL